MVGQSICCGLRGISIAIGFKFKITSDSCGLLVHTPPTPLSSTRAPSLPTLSHTMVTLLHSPFNSAQLTLQASEARLYQFSPDTTARLRKFRLSTSRAKTPQAIILTIDKKTFEIKPADKVYESLEDVADELPEHAPRFVLLSYPTTLKDGRMATPYVMLNWMPVTVGAELKMLYAGAKELARNTAEVGKILEVAEEEDIIGVGEVLKEG
jgi:hypothetical protein